MGSVTEPQGLDRRRLKYPYPNLMIQQFITSELIPKVFVFLHLKTVCYDISERGHIEFHQEIGAESVAERGAAHPVRLVERLPIL